MSYGISLLVFCRHSFEVHSFQLFVTVKMARILDFLKKQKPNQNKKTEEKDAEPRCSGSHENPGTDTLRKPPNIARIIYKSSELALWNDTLLWNRCFLTVKLLKKQEENLFGTADFPSASITKDDLLVIAAARFTNSSNLMWNFGKVSWKGLNYDS